MEGFGGAVAAFAGTAALVKNITKKLSTLVQGEVEKILGTNNASDSDQVPHVAAWNL